MEKPEKKKSRIAYIVLGFMALAFTLAGGGLTFYSYQFSENALAAEGIVLEVNANYSDGSTTYQPTIAYVDYKGDKYIGETFLSSSGYNFRLGSKVDILYDTRNPNNLRIDSWFAVWGFSLIFLVAGVVMALIAFIVGRVSKKPKAARVKSTRRKFRTGAVTADNFETEEEHRRETEYVPTVRRR